MNRPILHFVDPTIPGLSGRDLLERASQAIEARCASLAETYACWRRDHRLRHDLARLDRQVLRDVGLDRGAS